VSACSMRKAGKRRPCCFNRNACAEPSVSRGGVLLESSTARDSPQKNDLPTR
jgi:hypothetical protein